MRALQVWAQAIIPTRKKAKPRKNRPQAPNFAVPSCKPRPISGKRMEEVDWISSLESLQPDTLLQAARRTSNSA
jgi:hypothetical protein